MDSLSNLGKLYKLKLNTMAEAAAMTSFEVNLPRFLSTTTMHVVVDVESSFFSHIPSYAKWNEALEGYKKRWKKELNIFRLSHTELIQSQLQPSSPLYHLALASLTESSAWVLGFINFIDETYVQYSSGKFGTKKSWHVTTKLACALINHIGVPRRGVMNAFKAGDAQRINEVIFLATLKSLDRMQKVMEDNFKDSPAVSTELVKFLSMNTSVEAVDRLTEQSSEFKTAIAELTKKLAGVGKDGGTVGNKVDRIPTRLET